MIVPIASQSDSTIFVGRSERPSKIIKISHKVFIDSQSDQEAAQASSADTAKLAIAGAVAAIGITPGAEGTLGHGPVMILAAVKAIRTDWHREYW